MTKKKNRFWTFVFSLMPGAAEMYMGFMKMGLTLMGLFMGVFMLAFYLQPELFLPIAAVVWFYSFFHAHNLRGMDDEDFYALEDDYLIHLDHPEEHFWTRVMVTRYRQLAAIALILIGILSLWNSLMSILQWILPEFIRETIYYVGQYAPKLVFAVAILLAGIWLIRGKKQELQEEEEKKEDGREEDTKNP